MKLVFAGELLVLSTVAPAASGAQSDVAFPREVYAQRRAALAARLPGATIVLAGAYLINPGDGLVKQDPDFWYLTGVESPYAILVITSDTNAGARPRSVLFVPDSMQFAGGQFPMDEPAFRGAAWNRPRRRLTPGVHGIAATGVDASYPLSEFAFDVDWALLYGPEWAAMNHLPPASVVFAVGSEISVYPKG